LAYAPAAMASATAVWPEVVDAERCDARRLVVW
jgi:hypothetical protein